MRLVLTRRRRHRGWLFWKLILGAALVLAIAGGIDADSDPPAQCQRPNTYEACR